MQGGVGPRTTAEGGIEQRDGGAAQSRGPRKGLRRPLGMEEGAMPAVERDLQGLLRSAVIKRLTVSE